MKSSASEPSLKQILVIEYSTVTLIRDHITLIHYQNDHQLLFQQNYCLMTDGKAQNSPAPIVLAKGVSRRLPASAVTSPPSPPEETDTWGAGGGGIANLSCSSLDNVDAAGATVGKSMLPFANTV